MSATLKLTHKAIGVEVRRGTYDVVVDAERVGSLDMNGTLEVPIEAADHTLQVRNGRNLSRTLTFDAAEGRVVAFRCTGKRFLPIFLVSFFVPRLALSLRPGSTSSQNRGLLSQSNLESTFANRSTLTSEMVVGLRDVTVLGVDKRLRQRL